MAGQRGKPCKFHTCILNECIILGLGSIAIEYLDGNNTHENILDQS
jgi:hypothetical protein